MASINPFNPRPAYDYVADFSVYVRAIEALGYEAVVMSTLAPVVMLFVLCKGGVSHNLLESVMVEDVAVTLDVMHTFLVNLVGSYNLAS